MGKTTVNQATRDSVFCERDGASGDLYHVLGTVQVGDRVAVVADLSEEGSIQGVVEYVDSSPVRPEMVVLVVSTDMGEVVVNANASGRIQFVSGEVQSIQVFDVEHLLFLSDC